jgi:hypothetical protein
MGILRDAEELAIDAYILAHAPRRTHHHFRIFRPDGSCSTFALGVRVPFMLVGTDREFWWTRAMAWCAWAITEDLLRPLPTATGGGT